MEEIDEIEFKTKDKTNEFDLFIYNMLFMFTDYVFLFTKKITELYTRGN